MEPIRICPKCGGPVRYYHGPESITRVVCKGTCKDWTVIETIDNSKDTYGTEEMCGDLPVCRICKTRHPTNYPCR